MDTLPSFGMKQLWTPTPMARLQTLNYIIGIDDIAMAVSEGLPSIMPDAIVPLMEEIKQSALMHACAWLGAGGVRKWRFGSAYDNTKELGQHISQMAQGITISNKEQWQFDSHHKMTTNWAISLNEWAMANAIFSYRLVDTILTNTEGLVEFAERFDEHTLFFTPQRIWSPGAAALFAFSISLVNRELIGSTGTGTGPGSIGY